MSTSLRRSSHLTTGQSVSRSLAIVMMDIAYVHDPTCIVPKAPLILPCPNRYLEDTTVQIRARTIPWEGYQRAALITKEELAQIRRLWSVAGISGFRFIGSVAYLFTQ
ncbi:hypothetical protein SeLEV6574_g05421 [Synchytrium endobioticum]|uniref:Uncharacterized protein n=1 Tax=Synchytrium endobioticum TaxID=286115 RepID=A0A507CUK6_9FUNG|nr:hypothetical protein SeLEV6574_g05421 [Synchytrium endobioticum]